MSFRPHIRAFQLLALAVALVGAPRRAAAQGYVVVVNVENSASALPRGEVSRLFLKKIATWPSGEPVAPVDLPERSSVRNAFSKQVHGTSTNAVTTYDRRARPSRRARRPPSPASAGSVRGRMLQHWMRRYEALPFQDKIRVLPWLVGGALGAVLLVSVGLGLANQVRLGRIERDRYPAVRTMWETQRELWRSSAA